MSKSPNLMVVSADCHAGAQMPTYREYLPKKYRPAFDEWLANFEAEMEKRAGTFFDQDSVDERDKSASVLAGGIEGEWDEVFAVVKKCYEAMAVDCDRVTCSMKVDARAGEVLVHFDDPRHHA